MIIREDVLDLPPPKYLRGTWTLARGAPTPLHPRRGEPAPPPLRRTADGVLALPALDQGSWRYVTISADDSWACASNWFVSKDGYVVRNTTRHEKQVQEYLHRVVMTLVSGAESLEHLTMKLVDHRDRHPLNNTRPNLRFADQTEQNLNQTRNFCQPLAGVTWHEGKGKWHCRVKRNGVTKHIGWFKHQQVAVAARRRYLRQIGVIDLESRQSCPECPLAVG